MTWIVRGATVAVAVTLALTIAGCGGDNAPTAARATRLPARAPRPERARRRRR